MSVSDLAVLLYSARRKLLWRETTLSASSELHGTLGLESKRHRAHVRYMSELRQILAMLCRIEDVKALEGHLRADVAWGQLVVL